MCLIAFALGVQPRWPLLLVGNRDEFHGRAATAAEFQPDAPGVYGGRDLEKQGGWLQASESGRLAAVTNVRVGLAGEAAPRSRGHLVAGFVRGEETASEWVRALAPQAAQYGRFNLLAWDGREAWITGNHPAAWSQRIAPGVHGLSNGAPDSDWPKVRRARAALARWIDDGAAGVEPLFEMLRDEHPAPDEQLPDTGVGLDLERRLSPVFIRGERYGTRCSSVVMMGRDEVRFLERRFGPDGVWLGESEERFERR